MANKQPTKKEEIPESGEASRIAIRHLINPGDDKLSEVSYLPIGSVHSLTMMQSYEEHLETLVNQVSKMKIWYLKRQLRRKVASGDMTLEAANNMLEETTTKIEAETLDLTKLFIHHFRHSYYQHSRGKEGKFAEAIVMLSDTDMQTRNPDMEDVFSRPSRAQ